MFESFLQRHPFFRLVVEHPGHEVQHDALLVSGGRVRAVSAVLRQGPAVLAGVARGGQPPVPGQPPPGLEELSLGAPDELLGEMAQDAGHHGQVLQVVVGLEQCVTLHTQLRSKHSVYNSANHTMLMG